MPGLVFYIAVVCLPIYIYMGSTTLSSTGFFSVLNVAVFSTVFGYLLDSIGAYGWHLHWREYRKERDDLVGRLAQIATQNPPSSDRQGDPDHYIATLWFADEKAYDRILLERAEWVAILEVSSALLMSAVVIATYSLILAATTDASFSPARLALMVLLVVVSYAASGKGIQRMAAHDTKLVVAVRQVSTTA